MFSFSSLLLQVVRSKDQRLFQKIKKRQNYIAVPGIVTKVGLGRPPSGHQDVSKLFVSIINYIINHIQVDKSIVTGDREGLERLRTCGPEINLDWSKGIPRLQLA